MEINNTAKKAYNDIIKVISKSSNSSDLLVGFDVLLQFSLLQVAINDDEFNNDECEFITSICQYGDLITFMNNSYLLNYTWKDFLVFPVNQTKTIMDIVSGGISVINKGLREILITAASKDKDLVSNLRDNIYIILNELSLIDGREFSEFDMKDGCLILDFLLDINISKFN